MTLGRRFIGAEKILCSDRMCFFPSDGAPCPIHISFLPCRPPAPPFTQDALPHAPAYTAYLLPTRAAHLVRVRARVRARARARARARTRIRARVSVRVRVRVRG